MWCEYNTRLYQIEIKTHHVPTRVPSKWITIFTNVSAHLGHQVILKVHIEFTYWQVLVIFEVRFLKSSRPPDTYMIVKSGIRICISCRSSSMSNNRSSNLMIGSCWNLGYPPKLILNSNLAKSRLWIIYLSFSDRSEMLHRAREWYYCALC